MKISFNKSGVQEDVVSTVALYLDNNSNCTIDDLTLINESTLTNSLAPDFTFTGLNTSVFTTANVSDTTIILSATIVDDISSIGSTFNVSILSVGYDSSETLSFSSLGTTEIEVTGISTFAVTDVSEEIVLINKTISEESENYEPLLHLSVQIDGEASDGYEIEITNSDANFVTENGQTSGITKLSLYAPGKTAGSPLSTTDFSQLTFVESDIIQSISAGEFTSTSKATLTITDSSVQFSDGTPKYFFILYSTGEEFPLTVDGALSAEITGFTATGNTSELPMSRVEDSATIAAPPIAGFTYNSIDPYEFEGNTTFHYRHNATIPVMQIDIASYQTTTNITQINLNNTGATPFRTNANNNQDITNVKLFLDNGSTGKIDFLDGLDSNVDALIGSVSKGTTSELASIPLTTTLQVSPFDEDADEDFGYPQNNIKRVFVVYYTGTSVTEKTTSENESVATFNAILRSVQGTVTINNSAQSVNMAGTLPATDDTVSVTLDDDATTPVYIVGIDDIAPEVSYSGQSKVPIMRFQLGSTVEIASASITIQNNKNSFGNSFTQINKIWLYRDETPTSSTFDSTTTLISTNSNPGSNLAVMSGVPIKSSENNHFFVLYDLGSGIGAASDSAAQLYAFSDSQGLYNLSGFLPNPITAIESDTQVSTFLNLDSIESSVSNITSSTGTFNVDLTISRGSDYTSLDIEEIQPRFYQLDDSGIDVTYEFDIEMDTDTTVPSAINSSSPITLHYNVRHKNPETLGNIIMDGYAKFQDSSQTSPSEIKRYYDGANWIAAVEEPVTLRSTNVKSNYDWTLPSYIKRMEDDSGKIFSNDNVLQENTRLHIFFNNDGLTIDESSFSIDIDGTAQTLSSDDTPPSGKYFYEDGELIIGDLGSESGTLTLSLDDIDGNQLETASIRYSISSTLEASDILFYPNPFPPTTETLKFGINLTQQADIDLYFVNYLGQLVKRISYDASETVVGYNLFELESDPDYLKSGHYIVKAIISDGDTEKALTTKLAIY